MTSLNRTPFSLGQVRANYPDAPEQVDTPRSDLDPVGKGALQTMFDLMGGASPLDPTIFAEKGTAAFKENPIISTLSVMPLFGLGTKMVKGAEFSGKLPEMFSSMMQALERASLPKSARLSEYLEALGKLVGKQVSSPHVGVDELLDAAKFTVKPEEVERTVETLRGMMPWKSEQEVMEHFKALGDTSLGGNPETQRQIA